MTNRLSWLVRTACAAILTTLCATSAYADSISGLTPAQRRASNLESASWGASECTDDTDKFTDYEYTYYIMTVLQEIGIMTMSGGTREGTEGTFDEQIAKLTETNRTLNQCKFDKHTHNAGKRALASCKVMLHELYALQTEAAWYMRKQYIQRADWINGIEKLLPAAQACRDRLGRCYNPNSKTQSEMAAALFAFEAYIRDVTNGQAGLSVDLPPCSKTNIAANEDKPDADNPNIVAYANLATRKPEVWAGTPGLGPK